MNFMSGALEEGKLRTGLGDIPIAGQLQRDLAGSKAGRDVIVGIRPENFEDGALVPAENRHNGITFPATIDVVESLGSEKFVYFSKELGTVETAELAELAQDAGRAEGGATAETVVARLDPATTLTEGQDTELWVDVRAVHVFDPETGRNLTLGDAGASAAPAAPAAGGTAPAAAPDGSDGPASDQEDTGSATTPPR
jgi:multiple sugar transport system ATP-binding protein